MAFRSLRPKSWRTLGNRRRVAARPDSPADGLDNIDGGPECGVYIQMRAVQQVRIRRAFERCRRARAVALIPPQDVGEHIGGISRRSGGLQLGHTARRANLWGRRDENFHIGVRKNHRSNVAAIDHRARRRATEAALQVDECGAHLRNC